MSLVTAHGPQRYLIAGEYGERTNRAHYHALLFGCTLTETQLQSKWHHGSIDVRPMNAARIAYTAQYSLKKLRGKLAVRHYDMKGRIAPFHLQSQSLGRDYALENLHDLLQDQMYLPSEDGSGTIVPVPRAMLQRLQRVLHWVSDPSQPATAHPYDLVMRARESTLPAIDLSPQATRRRSDNEFIRAAKAALYSRSSV